MYRGRRIAVVIPCYEVARHIRHVVQTLPDLIDDVVLVDDGSRDNLHGELCQFERPGMIVLRHDKNQGLARAMQTGLKAAVACGADIIVKMDGDGQMDPVHLPRLLLPIIRQEADFTKGNRFVYRRDSQGMPGVRLLGNLGLSFLTKLASGYWTIFDPTNGYIAMRREVVEALEFERLGPGYFFESSMLVEAYLTAAVVKDVSIPSKYADEESSLSPARILARFPPLLIRAAVRRILIRYFVRDFTPVALFLLAGGLLTTFGVTFGGYQWFQRYGSGVPTPTGTILVAVMPLLAGFELLVQAIVMDIGSVPQKSPWIDSAEDVASATVPLRDANRVNERLPLAMVQRAASADEQHPLVEDATSQAI
jgi:dolichol-phosphate mannosyltransferase